MENMSNSTLPPIPDGCGILPVAENRIAHGPEPELLDAVPEGFDPPAALQPAVSTLNDALEAAYRRVLARAFAIAAVALFFSAVLAHSLQDVPFLQESLIFSKITVRLVFGAQMLFVAFCSRYVEELGIEAAGTLLFAYAAFTAIEFSLLISPAALVVVFLCAGLMYAGTAAWGYLSGADLARPAVPVFMIMGGGVVLVAVNSLFGTSKVVWGFTALEIVIFAVLAAYHAQEIRDFYQDFDDDNAQGWKASVLGALLLFMNSVNVYLLLASFLPSRDETGDD